MNAKEQLFKLLTEEVGVAIKKTMRPGFRFLVLITDGEFVNAAGTVDDEEEACSLLIGAHKQLHEQGFNCGDGEPGKRTIQ